MKKIIIALILLILSPLILGNSVKIYAASPSTSFIPSDVTITPASPDFTAKIFVNAPAVTIRGYQIYVQFDPSKVRVTGITYVEGRRSANLGGEFGVSGGDENNLDEINARNPGVIYLLGEIANTAGDTLGATSKEFVDIGFTSVNQQPTEIKVNVTNPSITSFLWQNTTLDTLNLSSSTFTVSVPISTPTPTPLPAPPTPTPLPPTPTPAAPSCTEFTIPGLNRTGQKNGGPLYTVPAAGDNKLVNIKFTPAGAQASFTVASDSSNAPPLNINPGASNSFIADIPPNTSTTLDNTYTIQATISSNNQQAVCFPVTVVVAKTAIDTACPANINSTEVKFRNADNTGPWLGVKPIQLGQSARVAGFHNATTPEPPPSDVTISVSGPQGFSQSGLSSPLTFTADPAVGSGAYVFTATTIGKVGEKCTGAATLTVIPVPTPPSPTPTSTPTPIPVGTGCFFMDDKPIIGKSCTDAGAQAYDTHPKTVPLTLTTAGKKTIFVRFISNLGVTRDFQRVINFNPEPKITEASCTHSLSGSGSVVTITGSALGPRGKGKIKVGAADATIITWNETTGVITATLDKRIEGKNDVEVIRDDGKTARAECTVGTTSVLFTAQSQCKSGNFAADNVSVKIFANAPTTIETEKPEPIIDEKVKLDKDGKPSGFAPKLEKDKKYSLIVKVPGTLAKRVDFETKGGTRNLDSATLLIGDIAPAQNPDGRINALDRSELTRQWSLVRDVTRTGDFNQDARVNSIDYACMRQNANQSDETFSPPTGVPSTPSTGVGTTAPSGVGTTTPAGIGTTTPAGIGTTSPPPAGGPSGTLPFRVSFDPNFATIALDGDMGTETVFTLDLTLTGGLGLKSVYVQFFEDGVWGPTPPQTASILLK